MATGTRASSRSKMVHKTALEQAQLVLKELPRKEKEHLSLAEAVKGMSSIIRDSISKGYTYDEVAGLLSDKLGVPVSAWSLKRYIPSESKRGRGKQASTEGDGEPKKRGRRRANPAPGGEIVPVSVAQLLDFPTTTAAVKPAEAPVVESSSNGAAAPESAEPETTKPKRSPRGSRSSTTRGATSKAKTTRSTRAAAPAEKPKRGGRRTKTAE